MSEGIEATPRRGMNPLVKVVGIGALCGALLGAGYLLGERNGDKEQRKLEEMVRNYRPAATSIDYGGRYTIQVCVKNNERYTYLIDNEKKLQVEVPTDIWDLADAYGWGPSRIAVKAGLKTGLGLKFLGEKLSVETNGEKPYVQEK